MAHFVDVPPGRPMDPVRDRSSGVRLGTVNESLTIGVWGVTANATIVAAAPAGGGQNGINILVSDTHVVQNGCRKFFIRGLVDGCTLTAVDGGANVTAALPVTGRRRFSWNDATPSAVAPAIKLLAHGSLQRFPPMPEATWRAAIETTLRTINVNLIGRVVLAHAARSNIIITPYIDTSFANADAGISFTAQDHVHNAAGGGAGGTLAHEMTHRIVLSMTGTWEDANASFNEPTGFEFDGTDFVSVLVQNMYGSAEGRRMRRKDHGSGVINSVDTADAQSFAFDFNGRLGYFRSHATAFFNDLKAVNVPWNPLQWIDANQSSM
jgi:hypothetical protein